MPELQRDGAAAPGFAAPERHQELTPDGRRPADEAGLLGGDREQDRADCADDGAAKQLSTLIACAALCGIEVFPVQSDIWLLRHHAGPHIGLVHGRLALIAALRGLGVQS